MNADKDYTELFERYLEDRLNDREIKEFEARLLIDPDFKAAFTLHKELDSALLEEEIMFFRTELEDLLANQDDVEWEAPMMLSKKETELLDEAILDQDVMSLRDQLGQIHNEVEAEMDNQYIPKYAGIERAVADQDSISLHDELGKFVSNDLVSEELTDEEVLDEEIDLAIMQEDVIGLRSKLDSIAAELMPETKVIPMSTRIKRAVSIAAVIMVLLGSGIVSINLSNTDHWVNKTMKSTIAEMNDPGSSRGQDENADKIMVAAYEHYISKEYNRAIELYNILDENGQGKPEYWIRQGQSYHKTKDYESAIRSYEKVLKENDNTHLEKADILLFDCLWKLDRKEEAMARLEAILNQDNDHQYKSIAQDILERMK